MNSPSEPSDPTAPGGNEKEFFFRDIDIPFLIHELKDPIAVIETGMRALLERQEKYGPLQPRQLRIIKRSLRNSRKVRDMVYGLLEVGRSQASCFLTCRFNPAESALKVLLETLESTAPATFDRIEKNGQDTPLHQVLTQDGIDLEIHPAVREAEMDQDETKFRQIVGNLIKNALHHRQRHIAIKLDCRGECLRVTVGDDGPGVPREYHETIFQRYRQVKPERQPERSGHGLGLAGARIMARCLGGDLRLNSQKGKGAVFILDLPRYLDCESDHQPENRTEA